MSRIPPHLRKFIVVQDYERYDEVAHAVWRFVLLHTHARLKKTAHPAYVRGLAATGLSVDRIPRIEDMDARLNEFGWGAACVDGFIPPRAFQDFQALCILPIAAEIRTSKHLSYTPAPDIIHEAAGHAPILVDPDYAGYIKRIGALGAKAFTLPEDNRVYDSIYALSELKETPDAAKPDLDRAEQELNDALSAVSQISEAARLSRLYWWTAEYGLVGTPKDYRLYGAGLLSSLGESHTCHDPAVGKLPLSPECMEYGYDITKEQPQLFVAKSFEHLHEVLDEAEKTLAYRLGGTRALDTAQRSQELATLELDGGYAASGVVKRFLQTSGEPFYVELGGPAALFHDESLIQRFDSGVGLALGRLAHDSPLKDASSLRGRLGQHTTFDFHSGLKVSGILHEVPHEERLELFDSRLSLGDELLWSQADPWPLVFGSHVTAYAGARSAEFFPTTDFPNVKVPRAKSRPPREVELTQLYEHAIDSWKRMLGSDVLRVFEDIHRELKARFPDEWLLRWNLLESLVKLGETGPLAREIERELEGLERQYQHREPIMTGLKHLKRRLH